MSLKTTYKEYILEKLLLEYLQDGLIPTSDELEEDLETYQKNIHPNIELPLSKFSNFLVEHGGESSASQIKDISSVVSDDISVIVREIYKLAKDSSRYYERWSNEIKRLDGKARKLEQRVDSLLLLANNTAGYFATVGDVFSDLNLVDTENTTAFVNLNETVVTLNSGSSSFESTNQIDLTGLTVADAVFSPLSKRSGTAYYPPSTDNDLINVFKTEGKTWVGKISTNVPGNMDAELKVALSKDSDIEISKVTMEWTGPNVASRSTVTLMYSADGYFWSLVPTTTSTKTIQPLMSWMFPLTTVRWIKFIFHKPSYDDGLYDYIFSIRNIKVFGNSYSQDLGNTFVSSALSTFNTENEAASFSLVQLDACETLPDNTDIKYYLAASKDNTTWTSWIPVLPSNRDSLSYPKVVNFGGINWVDNSSSDTAVFNSSFGQQVITPTFSATGITGYRFKTSSFGAINTNISVTTGTDPDPIANSIVLWRNIRYRDLTVSTSYPDTLKVRGVPRGWGFDGQVYSCFFEIVDSKGKFFDFGPKPCVIDNQMVTGVVLVSKGIHKFSTPSENWSDISSDLSSWPIDDEDTFSALDPLYPYNHKLLIEGVPYSDSFNGKKIYLGTDISAEFYSQKTSLFDLENNYPNDFKYFAVRGVGEDESNTSLAIIVRYNNINTDYTNELFLLKWRSGDQDSSVSQELYKYVKLKAELESSDTGITPEFSSYRLKLGV